MLKAASMLPNPMLNYWNSVTGFIIDSNLIDALKGTTGISSGAAKAFSGLFVSGREREDKKRTEMEKQQKNSEEQDRKSRAGRGIPQEVVDETTKLGLKCMFSENTKGANEEARMCLKSVQGADWGAIESYPEFVKELKVRWEDKVGNGGTKLRVNIILGEEDIMIGKKGMKYFEECWSQEKVGTGVEVTCVHIAGTDHDAVVDPREEAFGAMLKVVKGGRF